MVWQTYDYYFDPTAAYFGCKKACEPLHIQYNALTDSIEIVNHSAGNLRAITANISVFNLNGKCVYQKKQRLNSNEDTTFACAKLSTVMPQAPSDVYFLRLTLSDKKGVISENTYIRGRNDGDYRALRTLPKALLQQHVTITSSGHTVTARVTLRNKSRIPAPFLRLNLKGNDGEQILPVIYSDNYITLMPGEQKPVTVSWNRRDAHGHDGHIDIIGLQ